MSRINGKKYAESESRHSRDNGESRDDVDYGGGWSNKMLALYMKNIGRYPLLSREDEHELGMRIMEAEKRKKEAKKRKREAQEKKERGDQNVEDIKALKHEYRIAAGEYDLLVNTMVNHNLKLVIAIAKRFQGRGMDLLDLIQEGNIGLRHAVTKFDATRGFKISTYASWWIRQSIARALSDKGHTIRLPVHMVDTLNKLRKFTNKFLQLNGREPDAGEIAAHFGITVDQAEILCQHENRRTGEFSLDRPPVENPNLKFVDIVADESKMGDTESLVVENETRDVSRLLRGVLNPKEDRVIKSRYGIDAPADEADGLTLEEIGIEEGLTRERIRQIQAEALKKMRARALKILTDEEKALL